MSSEPPTLLEQPAPAAKAPWLVVQDSHGKVVHVVQLTPGGVRIGREFDNDVVLTDDEVSRHHAVIAWQAGQATVIDTESTNGSWLGSKRLTSNHATAWNDDAPLRMASYHLRLSATRPDSGEWASQMRSMISLALSPASVDLQPGQPAKVTAAVRNGGRLVDQVHLTVHGVPEKWVRVTPVEVNLLPSEESACTLEVLAPRESASEARDYQVTVAAVSRADPSAGASVSARWTVAPFLDPRLDDLSPLRARHRTQAAYTVSIRNNSNTPLQFSLRAVDDEQALRLEFDKARVELAPGQPGTCTLRVRQRRRLLGRDQTYRFKVLATTTPSVGAPLSSTGEFVQQPVGLLRVLLALLLLVLLLGATLATRGNPGMAVVFLAYVGLLAWLVVSS